MTELSPQARLLIDAARAADDPGAADMARVYEGLQARLGLPAAGAAGGVAGAAGSKLGMLKLISVLAVVGGMGLGGYLLTRPSSSSALAPAPTNKVETSPPPAEVAAVIAIDPEAETEAETEAEAEAETETEAEVPAVVVERPATRARPEPATSAADHLREEQALIARAQQALRAGQPDRALAILTAHQRAFADGILAPERTAARVMALCATGRIDEAGATAADFLARWPRSPLAPRVEGSCAR